MDLLYSEQHKAFRQEIRDFIAENLPDEMRQRLRAGGFASKADTELWQRRLNARGWGAPAWPKAFGGAGWDAAEQQIFADECACAPAPPPHIFNITMLGPVLVHFGSDAQREYFLPRLLNADIQVCQGFSEPGSGSDLASLKTRAERTPDGYLVNGQKIWTSQAHYSDWIFCLVRTDPGAAKPQSGISFILIDLKSPGITVRPIISIDGRHSLNEVFFDNVRVPAENLVGEENKGWDYAKFLLGHERTGIAGVGRSKAALKHLKEIARQETAAGRPMIEDARFRDRIAQVELELMALEITNMRVLSAEKEKKGGHAMGPEASILKIKGSEIQQTIAELQMQALGHYALPWLPEALDPAWPGEPVGADYAAPLSGHYFNYRKTTIYGGSNEIQKNIIAQMILGL